MDQNGSHPRVRYTAALPAAHADRARALEDAVRAAGFDLAAAPNAPGDAARLMIDELTSVLNRTAGLERLHELWALSVRHGEPLSCLLISVDQIRAINEELGVAAGDHVLRELARLLRAFARTEEHVCRLSGNEFLVICPKAAACAAAVGAERQRWAIQSSAIAWESRSLQMTVSVGVAERASDMSRIDELIAAAGAARTRAREAGGNRVHVAGQNAGEGRAPLLQAIISSALSGSEGGAQRDERRVLVLHEPHNDARSVCSSLATWGYAPIAVPHTKFDVQQCDAIALIAVIGRDHRPWKPVLRSIRSAARRIPVLLLGEGIDETASTELLKEGADACVSTSDPPRVLQQMIAAMAQSHAYQQQLADNQAMRAEQARMLTALFDLAGAFASANSIESCLDQLTQIAGELLRAGRVAILVSNRDRGGMSLARVSDGSMQLEDLVSAHVSDGIIGRACRSRETILLTSLDEDAVELSSVDRMLIVDAPAAITPMIAAQRVVGVLIACNRPGRREFKPWEVAILDLLSNIAAASIDDHHARAARDEAREAIVIALAKLTQHRDGPTAEHVDRVARMCVVLSRDLSRSAGSAFPEIDDAFISNLEWAVPLHDIGKVGLPDSILLKPGRLTDAEREIMRSHVEIGQSTLHSISQRVPEAEYLRMAALIAYSHHEWFDGSGYPMGLKSDEIPLAARIASVADAYDAITSSRVYKEAVAHEAACEEICKRAGTQFDPRIVEAFVRCKHMFAGLPGDDQQRAADRDAA